MTSHVDADGDAEPDVDGDVDVDEIVGQLSERARRAALKTFQRSVHIRHVDTGSGNGAEMEVAALTNPYYDMHRLGLFFTTSPRHADVLLVTGAVTHQMVEPLRRAYEAMPEPKLVVAAGAAAIDGGLYAESPWCLGGVEAVLPVDVSVPGSPPTPLSLLEGLLVAADKKAQTFGVPDDAAGGSA